MKQRGSSCMDRTVLTWNVKVGLYKINSNGASEVDEWSLQLCAWAMASVYGPSIVDDSQRKLLSLTT